jgi:hypothetical protein
VNTLPFYTLLRVVPNPASGEAVVVGLVLFDGIGYAMRVSPRKLSLAIKLVPHAETTIRFAVRKLENRVAQDTAVRCEALAADQLPDAAQVITQDNWNYLNRYMNGLVQVDKPEAVMLFADDNPQTVFEQLYESLVAANEPVKRARKKATVKLPVRKMIERVKTRVHTNVTLTPAMLPDLFFQLKLECIGMNGSLIGAHSLPLDRLSIGTLQQHYSECQFALKSLTQHYQPEKPEKNKLYLLADEPNHLTDSDKHKFWQAIQGNPVFKVLRTDEAEMVAEQIEKTGAQVFLKTDPAQQEIAAY